MSINQQSAQKKEDAKFVEYVTPLCGLPIGDRSEVLLNGVKQYVDKNNIDLNEIQERDDRSESIVFFAIRTYAPALLKFLVENGASLNVTSHTGSNPLEFAKIVADETLDFRSETSQQYLLAQTAITYLERLEK